MTVKELIDRLSKIDLDKTIDIVVNIDNAEDENEDVACGNLELWDNGSECATLFISRGEA